MYKENYVAGFRPTPLTVKDLAQVQIPLRLNSVNFSKYIVLVWKNILKHAKNISM